MTWTCARPLSAPRNHSSAGRCSGRSKWWDLYSDRGRGRDCSTATTSAASGTPRSTLAWVITGEAGSRRLLPEKPDSSHAISTHDDWLVIRHGLQAEGLHAVARRHDDGRDQAGRSAISERQRSEQTCDS